MKKKHTQPPLPPGHSVRAHLLGSKGIGGIPSLRQRPAGVTFHRNPLLQTRQMRQTRGTCSSPEARRGIRTTRVVGALFDLQRPIQSDKVKSFGKRVVVID